MLPCLQCFPLNNSYYNLVPLGSSFRPSLKRNATLSPSTPFSVDPYGNKAKRQRSTLAWQKFMQDCGKENICFLHLVWVNLYLDGAVSSTCCTLMLCSITGSNTMERPKVAPFPVVTPEGKAIKKGRFLPSVWWWFKQVVPSSLLEILISWGFLPGR